MKQVESVKYKNESPQFSEDFKKAMATAITAEELKERMHKHIDSWPWKDR